MSDIQTVELALMPERFNLSCDSIAFNQDKATFWAYSAEMELEIDVYYFFADRLVTINSTWYTVPEDQTLGGFISRLINKLLGMEVDNDRSG